MFYHLCVVTTKCGRGPEICIEHMSSCSSIYYLGEVFESRSPYLWTEKEYLLHGVIGKFILLGAEWQLIRSIVVILRNMS